MSGLKNTGYSETTAEHLLIDSAVIFRNVTFTPGVGEAEGAFEGDLIGATSGGVSFKIETTYRQSEVDGTLHADVKELKRIQKVVATATAKIKELTAKLISEAINGLVTDATAAEAPAGYKKIVTKREIQAGSWSDNLAIVGRLSSGQRIIVVLDNVLVTSGLSVDTEDNNEAVVEQVYTAHATTAQILADEYPWRIYYPEVI